MFVDYTDIICMLSNQNLLIPPQKNFETGMGWGCTSPGSAFGYMYVNGGTTCIIVGNDLNIGGMGEAKRNSTSISNAFLTPPPTRFLHIIVN